MVFNRSDTIAQGTDFSGAAISGSGSLIQAGAGTLRLTASNTYTGGTMINSGILQFSATNAMPSSGTVTGSCGATLAVAVGGAGQFTNGTSGAGTIGGLLRGTGGQGAPVTWVAGMSLGIDTTAASGTYSGVIANVAGALGLTKLGANALTLSGSNTYTGATTISSGTLQIGAGGTMGSLPTSSTITDNGVLVFNRSDTIAQGTDFSGTAISGSGSLTQAGAGTLRLTASNTYTGATTISSGTLQIGAGGTVGSLSGGSAITDNGALVFNRSDNIAQSNNISGNGSLTQAGSGTLTISGSSSYTGATTISSGTLQIGAGGTAGSLSTSSAITDNGALVFNRSDTIAQGTDFSGAAISGSGSLIQAGSGKLTLNTANSYTGATTIGSGTLQIGAGGTVGSLSNSSTITNNGVLVFNRSDTVTQGTDFSGAAISGSGSLTQAGSGQLTLNAANSYSGGTTIISGSLVMGNANALGATTGSLAVNGGTLDLMGNSLTVGTLSGSSGAVITSATSGSATLTACGSGAGTYGGVINDGAGTIGLTYNGSGSLILSGSNAYSGATTISSGTLQIGAGGTTGALSGSNAITDNGALVFNRFDAIAQSNNISGNGSLTQSGSGTLTLSGSNSYTGATIFKNGILALASANALAGSGTLSFTGGTLQYSGSNQTDYSAKIKNSTGAISIDTNNQSVIFASSVDSTNTGGLTKIGTGNLTLNVANTYTGATTVSAGAIILGNASAISTSGTVTINANPSSADK